ncbi:MAG: hypothetical protein WCK82_14915 [Bacteroidota bacterium]
MMMATNTDHQHHHDDDDHHHHHQQQHRPDDIVVDASVAHDGNRVITAHITLSEDDWRLLTEDQAVGMFEADTLTNRIRALLFWELKVEAANRRPLTNEEIAALDRLAAETRSDSADDVEDVPF